MILSQKAAELAQERCILMRRVDAIDAALHAWFLAGAEGRSSRASSNTDVDSRNKHD